jgi:DnaJ-class molecular chaperone
MINSTEYMEDDDTLISASAPLSCEPLFESVDDMWDSEPERPCPRCHGTGLDRYEEDECEHCFGEGSLPELTG